MEATEEQRPASVADSADGTQLSPAAVQQTMDLIRPWIEYLPPNQRWLGFFILLSLLGHTIAFFSLRIDTTRPYQPHYPHFEAGVETGQADAFWDSLNDPRLFVLPSQSTTEYLQNTVTPLPSIWLPNSLPLAAGLDAATTKAPALPDMAAADPGFQLDRVATDERAPEFTGSHASAWWFDSTLQAMQPSMVSKLPSLVSNKALEPTDLNVAVNVDGDVQYVMVQGSCGDPDSDRLAARLAKRLRFQPGSPGKLIWGKVTVFWDFHADVTPAK